jgi:hypothetical protein
MTLPLLWYAGNRLVEHYSSFAMIRDSDIIEVRIEKEFYTLGVQEKEKLIELLSSRTHVKHFMYSEIPYVVVRCLDKNHQMTGVIRVCYTKSGEKSEAGLEIEEFVKKAGESHVNEIQVSYDKDKKVFERRINE